MPRLPWDTPASEICKQLPGDVTLRIWAYRTALVTNYNYVAKIITLIGYDCDDGAVRQATNSLRMGKTLKACPRCGMPTPSTTYCASCKLSAENGVLTPRERERLAAHYQESAQRYAESREQIRDFQEDDYTR